MKNRKTIKFETMDLKTMDSIIKYLMAKSTLTFATKRAIICFTLMFITGCGIRELKNFNKLTIYNLYRNKNLIIYTSGGKPKEINIGGFEMDLLKSILPIVDEYYKYLEYDKHIMHSVSGKEMDSKSIGTWLNCILKAFGDKNGVYLTTKSFKNLSKIRKELLSNFESE